MATRDRLTTPSDLSISGPRLVRALGRPWVEHSQDASSGQVSYLLDSGPAPRRWSSHPAVIPVGAKVVRGRSQSRGARSAIACDASGASALTVVLLGSRLGRQGGRLCWWVRRAGVTVVTR
jgi:hypothetical protein